MRLKGRIRKLALVAHIGASVAWMGSILVFTALAAAGLMAKEPLAVRSTYITMGITAWSVVLPLAFASLMGGIAQDILTEWGLMRHYWVVAKLLIATVTTLLLLLHMRPIESLAAAASAGDLDADLHGLRVQMLSDSIIAATALVAALILAVFKPKGVTPYGSRAMSRT